MTVKPWLAPDIAESIRSGVPKPWLAPDLASAIRAGHALTFTPPDIAEDIDAIGRSGDSVGEIVIDFQNGVYTVDGAVVAVTDLLGEDVAWHSFAGASLSDAIQAGAGYSRSLSGNVEPVCKGEALSRILAGATIIADVTLRGVSSVAFEAFESPSYSADYACKVQGGSVALTVLDYVNFNPVYGTVVPLLGRQTLAMNFTPNHIAMASGRDLVALDLSTLPANAFAFGPNEDTIHSIRIIPLVADEALQALCIPQGAKIHIDLVQQFAWTETDGIVAIDTLLGADPNTVNAWGTTGYNPANLTADGYAAGSNIAVALTGSALTKVLDAATVVARFKNLSSISLAYSAAIVAANGSDALEIDLEGQSPFQIQCESWGGSLSQSIPAVVNSGNGVINVMAFTVTPSRLDISANGANGLAGVVGSLDRPVGNPMVAALIDASSNDPVKALQSITIYDPLPSTAGLSALSETGVVNTAPHDIILDWGTPGSSFYNPDPGTIQTGDANPSNINPFAFSERLIATDDQGNPLTWTLTDDAGGAVTIFDGNFPALTRHLTVGTYPFTVRATDPGGLYVEQTFTITVTP